jgi:hypothetical protein
MLSYGLSLDIKTETEKVSVLSLRLRKVKSQSQQQDYQSAYTGLGLETPILVSLIPEGLGEMFECDSADMCTNKFLLVSMGTEQRV